MAKCQASVNSNNWNFSLKARSINQACYRVCFQSVIRLKIVTPVSASVILQLLSTSVLVCLGCCNKIPQIGCLKNINLFSHSSGDWKFKVKVLADQLIQVVHGGSLTSLQIAAFSLYPHMLQRMRPRDRANSLVSFIRLNPIIRAPFSRSH